MKLDIPYKTHLGMPRDAFDKAASRGVVGMKVPGGRALIAADMRCGYDLWPDQELLDRTGQAQRQALKRAGILGAGHHVFYGSDDMVARSPIHPPWAIYPLPPLACANLIVDMAVYIVTISSEPLLAACARADWRPSGFCRPDRRNYCRGRSYCGPIRG